jgi:uncharacterized RDD family membrane protein YckC
MTNFTIENQNPNIEISKKRYRIGAFIIDLLIYCLIMMTVGMFYGEPLENETGYEVTGLPALGVFLISFFLWPISEGIWGQTIGKRFMDIKVVGDDYNSIGTGQAFGRFFLGFVDYMFLIGLIIAATNKQNKRIGDLAANTIVIRHKYANTQHRV